MYSWPDVAAQTEAVYDAVMQAPERGLLDRFLDFRVAGSFGQLVCCFLETLLHLLWLLLESLQPRCDIDMAPDWSADPGRRRNRQAKGVE